MEPKREVRISKFLSYHLRHAPEGLGLTLEPGGWAPVAAVLAGAAKAGFPFSAEELDHVVAHNPKQRFAFDEGRARIRAQQGHTTEVDLQLTPAEPPALLFHGTPERHLKAIRAEGLKPMDRHHVHLSADEATARQVGARHGRPVVLRVDAAALRAAGRTFYLSGNGVWLVDAVPPEFIKAPWTADPFSSAESAESAD